MYLDALCKKYVAYECKNFHRDGLSNLVINFKFYYDCEKNKYISYIKKKINNDKQIEKGPLRKICEFLKGIKSFSIWVLLILVLNDHTRNRLNKKGVKKK